MKASIIFPVMGILAVAACAAPQTTGISISPDATATEEREQRSFVVKERLSAQARVAKIHQRIAFANAEDCGSLQTNGVGIMALSAADMDEDWQAAARTVGLDESFPTVTAVSPASPAQGRLREGDVLLSLNGTSLGTAEARKTALSDTGSTTASFTVRRNGKTERVTVTPRRTCNIPVFVDFTPGSNAFTDGKRIVISNGLLQMAGSDDELAVVIGHEMAHIASGHIDAKQQNALAGGFAGLAVDIAFALMGANTQGAFSDLGVKTGGQAFSQDFEREADYVGSYFAERAGYDVGRGKVIWRRIAADNPKSMTFARTHPTTPERYVALDRTAAEIEQRRASGDRLVPSGWTSQLR